MSNLIHNLRLTSIHFLLEKLYFLIPVGNKNVLGNMKVTWVMVRLGNGWVR